MKRLLLVALSLVFVFAGVGLAESAPATDETLTYALDKDESVLTVELVGNATTGYQWFCSLSAEGLVKLVSDEYVPDEADGEMTGAGGKSVFVFETAMQDAGMVTLTFDYKRSWEDEVPFSYAMNVWVNEAGLLSVESLTKTPPYLEGDFIACPECQAEDAVVTAVMDGGDEEGGVVWFIEIQCPNCGTVEDMV